MAGLVADPITAGIELGTSIINKLFPDKTELEKAQMQQVLTVFTAQAGIVQAEAASSNWLAASWRPITMLTFVFLIVARWFGFAAPNLGNDEYLALWSIVKLGLGGYVIGRSVEKVTPSVANAIAKR